MKEFHVVIYDCDRKALSNIIPRSFILQAGDNLTFGSRRYLFHHNDITVVPPSSSLAVSMIKDPAKTREDGFFYPGIVLAGFGRIQ